MPYKGKCIAAVGHLKFAAPQTDVNEATRFVITNLVQVELYFRYLQLLTASKKKKKKRKKVHDDRRSERFNLVTKRFCSIS